jgi:hypothetical protein
LDEFFDFSLNAKPFEFDSAQLVGAHDGRGGVLPVGLQLATAGLFRQELGRVLVLAVVGRRDRIVCYIYVNNFSLVQLLFVQIEWLPIEKSN